MHFFLGGPPVLDSLEALEGETRRKDELLQQCVDLLEDFEIRATPYPQTFFREVKRSTALRQELEKELR